MRFSITDLVDWSGATQVAGPDDATCEGATVDSRHVESGQLFVGVPGEHVDGGLHAPQAAAAGATAVLVSQEAWDEAADDLRASGAAVLVHPRPVEALGLMGRGALQRLGARGVGVSGCYG